MLSDQQKRYTMDPLHLNRTLMTSISVCSQPKGTSLLVRVRHQMMFITLFSSLLFGWVSCVVYIIKYVKIDLKNACYAIFQIGAELSAFYTLIPAYMQPDSTLIVFQKLKQIRENGNIFFFFRFFTIFPYFLSILMTIHKILYYFLKVIDYKHGFSTHFVNVDNFCYKLTKLMVQTILIVYAIISIVQAILNVLYCYYRDNDIDPQCLFMPYKFS